MRHATHEAGVEMTRAEQAEKRRLRDPRWKSRRPPRCARRPRARRRSRGPVDLDARDRRRGAYRRARRRRGARQRRAQGRPCLPWAATSRPSRRRPARPADGAASTRCPASAARSSCRARRRGPTRPCSADDSRFSSSRSYTFIPAMRRSSRMSRVPRRRTRQPSRSSDGPRTSARCRAAAARDQASARALRRGGAGVRRSAPYAAASAVAGIRRVERERRAVLRRAPSSACASPPSRIHGSPGAARAAASAGIMCSRCAHADTRKPGAELARRRGAAEHRDWPRARRRCGRRARAASRRRGRCGRRRSRRSHSVPRTFARHVQCVRPRSSSTARAAFAPGAPMTPPPGCVLEPHRYKPRTGARYCAYPGIGRLNSS